MNIRGRLLLVCFAVSVPILCICAIIICKEYQGLLQAAKTTAVFQDKIAARSLSQWILTQQIELSSLSVLPALQKPLTEDTNQLLANTARTQRDWNAVLLLDRNGVPLASSIPSTTATGFKIKKMEFFEKILKGSKIWNGSESAVTGYVNCPITGRPAILVGVPVYTEDKIQSILVASVNPSAILRLFSGLGEDKGSVIAVVDQNTRVTV